MPFPIGGRHRRDGRQRVGQELARRGHPLEGRRPASCTGRRSRPGRTTRSTGWSGSTRSSASTRPRSGARPPRRPATYSRRLRPDPRAVRQAARGEGPRLHRAAVQLQPGRRPLRGVRGGRPEADRDALPARRLGHLRGLRRGPLHGRDPGGEVPRPDDRRRARR